MSKTSRRPVLALAAFVTVGGVLVWWVLDGQFKFSAECKAATELLAERRVSSIFDHNNLMTLKAEQAVSRYCKRSF